MQGVLVPDGQFAEGSLCAGGVATAHITEWHALDCALGAVLGEMDRR